VQDVLSLLKATTPRVADHEWKGPGGLKKVRDQRGHNEQRREEARKERAVAGRRKGH
jgi:hypothetical protein